MHKDKDLYRSYKNKDKLPLTIVGSLICLVLDDGIIYIIIIWLCYWGYCHQNNKVLNNSPYVIEKRRIYEEYERDHEGENEDNE